VTDPMYRAIADDLERQIKAGDLPPGRQLRTEQALQRKYRASRNTVRDAVKWLIARGLVETRPGQGTFVVEKPVPFITTLSTDPELGSSEGPVYWGGEEVAPSAPDPPRVEIQRADAGIALELSMNEGDEVVSRHQARFIGETPWSLQTSFYPMSLVERGAVRIIGTSDISQGTVQYLKETLGLRQAGYRDKITVRAPNESETSFFGVPADGRVMILAASRTAFDPDGQPIRVTITVYPADRTLFAINAGQVPGTIPETQPTQLTGETDTVSNDAPPRGS
jgi:GntR family transcriptional regulator